MFSVRRRWMRCLSRHFNSSERLLARDAASLSSFLAATASKLPPLNAAEWRVLKSFACEFAIATHSDSSCSAIPLTLRTLDNLERTHSWDSHRSQRIVENAQTFIHATRGCCSVSALAQHVAMSPSALRSAFIDVIGQSPREYLAAERLRHAAALLKDAPVKLEALIKLTGISKASLYRLLRSSNDSVSETRIPSIPARRVVRLAGMTRRGRQDRRS